MKEETVSSEGYKDKEGKKWLIRDLKRLRL